MQTAEPKIEFQLTKVASDIAFNLPEGLLKVEDVPDHLRVATKVKELGIKASLYAIVNPRCCWSSSAYKGVVSKERVDKLIADARKTWR